MRPSLRQALDSGEGERYHTGRFTLTFPAHAGDTEAYVRAETERLIEMVVALRERDSRESA